MLRVVGRKTLNVNTTKIAVIKGQDQSSTEEDVFRTPTSNEEKEEEEEEMSNKLNIVENDESGNNSSTHLLPPPRDLSLLYMRQYTLFFESDADLRRDLSVGDLVLSDCMKGHNLKPRHRAQMIDWMI
jgi:hypothetical protein